MRGALLRGGLAAAATAIVVIVWWGVPGRAQVAQGEWRAYAADKASTKYSPLDQINKDTVKNVRIAWRQSATPPEVRRQGRDASIPVNYPHTPLMAGGLLYMNTGYGTVAALDPATGKVVWSDLPPDPDERGTPNRGLAYWADGADQRVVTIVGRYLVALNAKTGARYQGFGEGGRVDLAQGMRRSTGGFRWGSPPLVVRDVVIVGGFAGASIDVVNDEQPAMREMPPGDVRGFDVRTGKLLWTFHTVPEPGEAGAETWLQESRPIPAMPASGGSSAPTKSSATSTCRSRPPAATTTAAPGRETTCSRRA